MWLMTRLAIIFYVSVLWLGSLVVILFALHAFDIESVKRIIYYIYVNDHLRLVAGAIAFGLVLVSILFENLIYGRRRMERNIAFDNVAGEVSVSLSALEDLIKSLNVQVPEVKDIKPFLTANRKGIDAEIKLTLRAQVNIPELTARLQDLIRRKIEETIGMEGRINVRIHVAKMSLEDYKMKRSSDLSHDPQVPFHGYRT